MKKPKKYTKFLKFHEKGGKEVYSESGFAIQFLVKEYGKEKLLQLLKKAGGSKSKKEFTNLFKSIYKFELKYDNFDVL